MVCLVILLAVMMSNSDGGNDDIDTNTTGKRMIMTIAITVTVMTRRILSET